MGKKLAKVLQINDIIQWYENSELQMSPKYQRGNVWNEKAKAYLIDTIVRGLPMPPIFMRQTVDVATKRTYREIIDGQQRLKAIIEYVVDESFSIRKSHNKVYGGKYYSELDEDVQREILEYEILTEVISEKEDSLVYDMFARLNTNNVILNKQEIRNSQYWGDFKVLIYKLSTKYREFFLYNNIFSDKECARMRDSELINSMVVLLVEGIVSETPTFIDNIYKKYDKEFELFEIVDDKFKNVMKVIEDIYLYFNGNSGCFVNKNYFFTLYCVLVHQMYGINGSITLERIPQLTEATIIDNKQILFNSISNFISDFQFNLNDKDNSNGKYADFVEFEKCHKSRTTAKAERMYRIEFLNNALISGCDINDNGRI